MRSRIPAVVAVLALAVPAAASAQVPHMVASGESLTSIAAADGLSISQLAAENGISPDSQLTAGATILIPPQSYAGTTSGGYSSSSGDTAATSTVSTDTSAPASTAGTGGGYTVQPGDTLSAIAARSGLSVAELAAANGLDPNGLLLSGSALSVPGASSSSASTTSTEQVSNTVSSPASSSSSTGGPYPTNETMSAADVGSIGSSEGVPSSLADAIGYQESGFNNSAVSSAGAVGVMQIMPTTWSWINQTMTGGQVLSPSSAADNVRAGSLYLQNLLAQAGGSASLAAAGYYQGMSSVLQNGEYADTQQYVQNVAALQSQFGGG